MAFRHNPKRVARVFIPLTLLAPHLPPDAEVYGVSLSAGGIEVKAESATFDPVEEGAVIPLRGRRIEAMDGSRTPRPGLPAMLCHSAGRQRHRRFCGSDATDD